MNPVEVIGLLIGHLHGVLDQVLHLQNDQHLPLDLFELLRGHLVGPEGLVIDPFIECAVPLKGGVGKDGGLDVLVGHLDVQLFRFLQYDRLIDQIVKRLLFEVQALEYLLRQSLAETLAVHIYQILVLPLKIDIDDRLAVDHGDPLRPLSSPHRAEIEYEDHDDDPQNDLHEPVSGVLSHEVEHCNLPPYFPKIRDVRKTGFPGNRLRAAIPEISCSMAPRLRPA